jgi:hypothetical protein
MAVAYDEFILTADEMELLPTPEEVEHYAEHGWYLSRRLFTEAEIAALTAASELFYGGHRDRALPAYPSTLAYWTPEAGDRQRHNDYIHYESEAIGEILRKPVVGAVAAALSGAPEIRIFQSTLIYKPPRPREESNLVPWHFDKHYWCTSTSDRMLTAFIPLHDCGPEMGTITMVDGSHTWREALGNDRTARHFADRDRAELDEMLAYNARLNDTTPRLVPMEIPAGHVSFHHCRTYHGSGANRADRPRRAISLHLQDGANRYCRAELSDGTPVRYNHDWIVRRAAGGDPDYADPDFCPTVWRVPPGGTNG